MRATIAACVAACVLPAGITYVNTMNAANPQASVHGTHQRDRALPEGNNRRLRSTATVGRWPASAKVTATLIVDYVTPSLKVPPVQPMARLIRVRFTEGAYASASTSPNGNVLLRVPKRLRGAQRGAAVRAALRGTRLTSVPLVRAESG